MASTTVHIPDHLLKRVDQIARRRGVSRNRVVLASLEAEIARDGGEWPASFFAALPGDDQAVLAEATREMELATAEARRNRGAPLL